MIELCVECQGANGKQDESDVGIHDESQDALFQSHIKISHRLAHEVESFSPPIESLDGFSLHLFEQVFFTGSDVVDQLLRQGLLFGERFGLPYGGFGDLNIAAALGNNRTH